MNEMHPIQLRDILISRLSIQINDAKTAHDYEGEIELSLQVGTSKLVKEVGHIGVGILANVIPKVSESGTAPAFVVDVELNGQFTVDLEAFKFEDLERWSKVNAPFLLLPYVREHVYSLAIRAGVKGLIFPLFVQPGRIRKENDPAVDKELTN